VHEAITRCLQKDPRRRYPDIADARYEIERALADPGGVLMEPLAATELRSKWPRMLPWAAIVGVVFAIIAGMAVWKLKPAEPRQIMRFYDLVKDHSTGNAAVYPALALSADGRQLAYTTGKGIYLRSVDAFAPKLIAGGDTDLVVTFFSPDGQWIGYFSLTESKLKKIAISEPSAAVRR
jgi:hypothetical protein